MWVVLAVATAAALAWLGQWRTVAPPVRLLLLWIGVGAIELLVHDVGNERRFLFFVPALIALFAIVVGGLRQMPTAGLSGVSRGRALLFVPVVLFALYVVSGAAVRLLFLYEIRPNVRLAAAIAVAAAIVLYAAWPRPARWLSRDRWTARSALVLGGILCAGDLAQFAQWAAGRSYKNYEASIAIGRALAPGTLVHGKLANGLSLENRIRPVFVGREFGNYADRRTRDDVRYILTYVEPCVGYEGPVINDVLDAYPGRRILMTFDVAETTGGHDRAALIDKFGRQPDGGPAEGFGRACR
jgi:hypothetical protein